MFEWLEKEMISIQTPKFHLVDFSGGVGQQKSRKSILPRLSTEYFEFTRKFGNSRFFRQSLLGYGLGVVDGPRRHPNQESIYQVGFYDGKKIYLRENIDYVFAGELKKPVAESFSAWIEISYTQLKGQYSHKEWKNIVAGPPPFDVAEETIVRARDKFYWREIGINEKGDRLLEIENNSEIIIPCFSIGVRSYDGNLNGAIIIDVRELAPSSKRIYAVGCYKKFYRAEDLELFHLPRPGPEDREFLSDLKRAKS